jgi:DNA repair protein RadC
MIREAVVQYRGPRRKAGEAMRSPADVARFIRGVVGNDAREHFVTLMLDGRHRPIGYQRVSVGTATASLVHPREVFQTAIGLGAVALIVAHNHPSGDPSPSREDRDVVARLVKAGTLLGIPPLDGRDMRSFIPWRPIREGPVDREVDGCNHGSWGNQGSPWPGRSRPSTTVACS